MSRWAWIPYPWRGQCWHCRIYHWGQRRGHRRRVIQARQRLNLVGRTKAPRGPISGSDVQSQQVRRPII